MSRYLLLSVWWAINLFRLYVFCWGDGLTAGMQPLNQTNEPLGSNCAKGESVDDSQRRGRDGVGRERERETGGGGTGG